MIFDDAIAHWFQAVVARNQADETLRRKAQCRALGKDREPLLASLVGSSADRALTKTGRYGNRLQS